MLASGGPDSVSSILPRPSSHSFRFFIERLTETGLLSSSTSATGLYVARAICQLMDGAIEVASEKGEGSTFRFHIKVGIPELPTEPKPSSNGPTSTASTPTSHTRALDVLIVEGMSLSCKA